MKLNKAKTITLTHRVDLPEHLAYLSGGDPVFITAEIGPGGHLNPQYQAAKEAVRLQRKIDTLENGGLKGNAYIRANDASSEKMGRDLLAAVYDHCIKSWDTNIQDDGQPMKCDRPSFMALAEVPIPEVVAWFTEIHRRVDQVSEFIVKADEEAEKN